MNLALRLACALTIAATCLSIKAMAASPGEILSDSAILMDADSGQVLFDKNSYAKSYPASTTKILTALLAVETCAPEEVLTVSETALDIAEWDSANIALSAGERLTVNDALYALMLPSANDAANALAEHVAGSQERFAERMNQRAWQIGARNTRFTNAHGLHDPGHYTTGYDMALITQEAVRNPEFLLYFGAARYTMAATNRSPFPRFFINYQYMLSDASAYYHPDVIGGKVGYTPEAGHTMSTVAQKNGRTLVCVVMHSGERSQKFTDTQTLLQYGFEQFREITIPASDFRTDVAVDEEESLVVYTESDFTALLRKDIPEDAVEISYDYYAPLRRFPSFFQVVIPTEEETLPSLLGKHPALSGRADAVKASGSAPSERVADGASPLAIAAVVLSCALVALLAAVIARYRALRKRRR